MIFQDREDAGRQLAKRLEPFSGCEDLTILGIPRGGVVVAIQVARALHAPFDVFNASKLSVPGHAELAFGAMAEGGECFLDDEIIRAVRISAEQIAQASAATTKRLRERAASYRAERPALTVESKTVILVDDGIATGASIHVSILALHSLHPTRLIVAVPVAPASTCSRLRPLVDELICVLEPRHFSAVSEFYLQFPQVTDSAISELLSCRRQTGP